MDTGIITRQVTQRARSQEEKNPAVSFENTATLSYQELEEKVNRYANSLLQLEVERGDRVGMLLYNCIEYWPLYLAITKLGCIAVRINWRLTHEELAFILHDSGIKVLCVHDNLSNEAKTAIRDTDVKTIVSFCYDGSDVPDFFHTQDVLEKGASSEPKISPPNLEDPCMLMYTSGTTGKPKGALYTHGNTLWFGAIQAVEWKYDNTTVVISAGPQYHVGAFEDHALPALMTGGHVVVQRSGGFSAERLAEIIKERRVTDGLLYPFMVYELLSSEKIDEFDLSSVRTITSGGSAIQPWAIHKLSENFPHIRLEQVYGLTEGGAMSTVMRYEDLDKHPASIGKPLPLTEVRVANQEDEHTDAKPEEVGELWVRSPSVCGGYFNRPDATAETYVDGWCKTGDLARMTVDGFLYIAGRVKDMIISGGENIYPAEIESVLANHPEIKDVAVVGVPDVRYQETPCAVVVAQNDGAITAKEVISYCRKHLAGYKRPRHVVFVNELPKNPSGKVLKRVLRDEYESLGVSV